MGRTKKVGVTGKFGPRYGLRVKKRIRKLGQKKKYICPNCLKLTVKRKSAGIWVCSKCGLKFAGKAYKPE